MGCKSDAVGMTEFMFTVAAMRAKTYGHGGSDFYTMYNFVEKILGNSEADVIDVYEALDMFLPGLFA